MAHIQLPKVEGSNFEKALSLIPEVKSLYDQLYEVLWNSHITTKELKERIRLYLANVNGCQTCISLSYVSEFQINQEVITEEKWSKEEQVLFSFIDRYRVTPKEASVHELKLFYRDEQITEILALINLFDSFHKIIVSLDLYDFCSL
ncbi:hypothetical protein [Metabacillus iocasae]|uniref:Alkylhydroperoxidase family enzyme n=1 Tax=Priestia iocasae TaxID=2291674 RepID=A0ABS2QU85_9BACI|nr:hypothetical protein [Metabacillus iocasae]MBM7703041.1 alkylhydroperoxidase family enzyme [Metabacillus iocasae]